jgi:hypothetical protein
MTEALKSVNLEKARIMRGLLESVACGAKRVLMPALLVVRPETRRGAA